MLSRAAASAVADSGEHLPELEAQLLEFGQALLDILAVAPDQQPPSYETLVGDLRGACSRRINIQHRLVYQVLDDKRIVKVLRLWSHYEQFRPATGGMADQPRSRAGAGNICASDA